MVCDTNGTDYICVYCFFFLLKQVFVYLSENDCCSFLFVEMNIGSVKADKVNIFRD